MEAGKRAMESAKAAAEKARAGLQAKAEKLTASHPAEKEAAEDRKQERIGEAEAAKRDAAAERRRRHHDVATAAAAAARGGGHVVGGRAAGGQLETGVAESQPIAVSTGTVRPSAAHNPSVGSAHPELRGTGQGYT